MPRFVFILLSVILVGCSGPQGRVHGVVTLDSQPLPDATVTFFSPNQLTYSVTTVADGSYELPGVVRGAMKVTVQMPPPRPTPRPAPPSAFTGETTADDNSKASRRTVTPLTPPNGPQLPERYGDPVTSGLAFEFTASDQRYDIALTSRP
ncbi:hypothetical protein BH11PLA2_BH11PLA2_02670 [soil metagenome]